MRKKFKYLKKKAVILVVMLTAVSAFGMPKNLLKNAGFEEQSPKTNFPAFWAKSSAYKGDFTIISDALEAYRGSCAVKVESSGKDAAFRFKDELRLNKKREITVSVWAKGNGNFSVYCYLYGKRDFLGSVKTELAEVNSDQWKKYEFSMTIPVEYGTPPVKTVSFSPAFHVRKGTVYFDEAAVQVVDKDKKETADQQTNNIKPTELLSPYIRIPQIAKAPVIDGKLEKNEWENAAAITGFLTQGVGKLSPQQSIIYISYDEKNLYFALKSTVIGLFKKGTAGRDNIKINGEAFEIWISPQEKQWFQFLGVPAGGFIDVSYTDDIKWNGNIKYASLFEDSGETAGGILTFNKTFWTAEVVIPLNDIGFSAPPPAGTVWRMNFCRDLAEINGKNRNVEQWTSWSPTKNHFTDTSFFGYVEFGGNSPAVQLSGFGDPLNGLINVNGTVNTPKTENIKLSSTIKVLDTGKILVEKDMLLSSKGEKRFSLEELVKISRTTDLVLEFSASDRNNTQRYIYSKIPFTCTSAFDVKVIPVYAKGFVDIELDTGRVSGICKNDRISVSIEGTEISGEKIILTPGEKIKFRFDISKLKTGDYIVKSYVANQNKKVIVSSAVSLKIPEKPEWLDNTIGISEKVPAPWVQVKTNGKNISVTDRKYVLADNGLPEQITVFDTNIFAGKPSVNFIINGKTADIVFEPIKNTSAKDTESSFVIKGDAGNFNFTGTLCTEYDGFSLLKFAVTPEKPLEIDAIYMDFPFNKDIAMYVRAFTYLPTYKNYSASLYEGTSNAKKVDIGGKWIYNPGWIWTEDFINTIWLGNDKIGFALATESDENIKGKKHIEFIKKDNTTIMRVHLVSSPIMLDKSVKYEYAWQATPVKPETKDPKKWHASYYANWPEDFSKRLYVGAQYGLISLSYPKLKIPVKSMLTNAHKYGAKVVPDFYLSAAQFNTPEQKLFGHEWEVTPRQSWSNMGIASASSSHLDFLLHTAKCYVEKFGFDGVYLDVSQPVASDNPYHDAGYTDENGRKHPTAVIWKLRELYKRLYTYLHTNGRDGVVFAHTAPMPGIVGFVDVVTAGEEWGAERENFYKRLSPDMFRTKEMHIQYGVPHTFYSFHQYSWRVNNPVPMEEILMMTLPHRVLPTIGDQDGGKVIIPVWDLMDKWITSSDFIPYWSPESPVKTNSESVLASIYNRKSEKQALMIVSNWGYDAAEANISVDFAPADASQIKMTEVYPGNGIIPVNNNSVSFPLKARGLKIIRIDY